MDLAMDLAMDVVDLVGSRPHDARRLACARRAACSALELRTRRAVPCHGATRVPGTPLTKRAARARRS